MLIPIRMQAFFNDRNLSIVKDRIEGRAMTSIAKDHSISPERVRQIVAKYKRICSRPAILKDAGFAPDESIGDDQYLQMIDYHRRNR